MCPYASWQLLSAYRNVNNGQITWVRETMPLIRRDNSKVGEICLLAIWHDL